MLFIIPIVIDIHGHSFKISTLVSEIHNHLPVVIKEIQTGYLVSPYFKDTYLYLAQNRLPSTKTAIQKVEILAERYITRFLYYLKLSLLQGKKQHY